MSETQWMGYSENGASPLVPCDHMILVDDLAVTLLRGVATMLCEHHAQGTTPTFIHEANTEVDGQVWYLAVTWTAHPANREITTDDQPSPN